MAKLKNLNECKIGDRVFSTSHGYCSVVRTVQSKITVVIDGSSIEQTYELDGLSYKGELVRELFVDALDASKYFKRFKDTKCL